MTTLANCVRGHAKTSSGTLHSSSVTQAKTDNDTRPRHNTGSSNNPSSHSAHSHAEASAEVGGYLPGFLLAASGLRSATAEIHARVAGRT